MRQTAPRLIALGLLACGAAGCGALGPHACDTGIRPAVEVVVTDAVTGQPAAGGAAGVVRDGAYVDSLRFARGSGDGTVLSLRAADERPGTYAVEVRKPGYLPWTAAGVRVGRGDCHVRTVTVHAALQPTP